MGSLLAQALAVRFESPKKTPYKIDIVHKDGIGMIHIIQHCLCNLLFNKQMIRLFYLKDSPMKWGQWFNHQMGRCQEEGEKVGRGQGKSGKAKRGQDSGKLKVDVSRQMEGGTGGERGQERTGKTKACSLQVTLSVWTHTPRAHYITRETDRRT